MPEMRLKLHLSTPGSSGAFPHVLLSCSVSGLEELEQAERAPLTHRTHLHGAGLLIRTSLGCHLKAVCHALLRGPVGGCQLLHEVLQADDSMVGLEGLQLEVLLVGHMDLQEKWGKAGGGGSSPQYPSGCFKDIH